MKIQQELTLKNIKTIAISIFVTNKIGKESNFVSISETMEFLEQQNIFYLENNGTMLRIAACYLRIWKNSF